MTALNGTNDATNGTDSVAIALADNGVLDYDAGVVFIFNTVDDLAGDNFGDISAIFDAWTTTNTGTHANLTDDQEVIVAFGNNTGDKYGIYHIVKDDDTQDLEVGDVVSLLAIVETSTLVAADFTFG